MSPSRSCTLLCGLWLVACTAPEVAPEKTDKAAAPAAPAPEVVPPTIAVKPETPPETPPAPAPEPAPPVVAADAKIEVEACDAYADRYRACIADKVPSVERDSHTRVLKAQLATWLAAKADPKLAPALDGECAAAAEAARAATRVFGCVWRDGDKPEPEAPKPGKLKPELVPTERGLALERAGLSPDSDLLDTL
ncbi:hypothetical protein [Nannocystis radixulma]|uniref:Lysozyme inhibitor LprI N-terminal domain-containing protein n=1 Tax=Nannocystis radixulma TaxID=2995305 RepID=A0ABT5AYA3_9BACT|nr:hypothetical protein [Nannocystis radixulma]MDC0666825.1 hypothetical protein [Nannocystis radixulma]